jgi:hypothetical protein
MLKPVRIVVGLVGTLIVLLIVGVVIAGIFIDSIARKGIEAGSTFALGVPTSLEKASVGITSGTFSMAGLTVDNPKGFEGKFMTLGSGSVAVSLSSLTSDTVVLPKFQLSDLELDLERGSSGANYQIILDNLKRLESGQKSKEPSKPGKKFKISEISISNVTVHADMLGGPAGLTKVNVPIHEIKLMNVGSDGSGVDIPELTSVILEAILAAAIDKGGGLIPADIMGDLKGGLGQLSGFTKVGVQTIGKAGEQLTQLSGDLGKATQGVQKGVEDVEGQLKKGLEGLIPGSKPADKKPGDK